MLLAFGIGMPAKVAFGAMHGIVPIAIFTMGALRNLNPVFLKAARVQRLSPWQTASTVLLPASVPEVPTNPPLVTPPPVNVSEWNRYTTPF